jgi:hypothetical protein
MYKLLVNAFLALVFALSFASEASATTTTNPTQVNIVGNGTAQTSCTKTMTYYMVNGSRSLRQSTNYSYYNVTPANASLCPGKYRVTLHFILYANQGGGSGGCGGYVCGLGSSPMYDLQGNQIFPGLNLGSKDWQTEYNNITIKSDDGSYTDQYGDGPTKWTAAYLVIPPTGGTPNGIGNFSLQVPGDNIFTRNPSDGNNGYPSDNTVTLTWLSS